MTLLGHGNVSLDIARIMFSPPERLAPLDLPDHVVEKISNTSVRHISIVSRRGPTEVAFTAKELRELLTLPRAAMVPIPEELLVLPPNATRQQTRILGLLRKGSTTKPGQTSYTWSLDFFRSPAKVTGHTEKYTTIEYNINQLDGQKRAVPTGETEMRQTQGVVGSIGYRSEPIEPGWFDGGLGRIRNVAGRVFNEENQRVKGVYSSGWASNGAKGVLATTMMDAYSVAETLLIDHLHGETTAGFPVEVLNSNPRPGVPPEVEQSTARIIGYGDWIRIDKEEIRRGQERKKERERMVWADVIKFLA
jgi:adrenodoxin-NADP+ reductase